MAGSENLPLEIKVQFLYEDEKREIKPLDNDSVLKSGQKIGVAFSSKENCSIYIFWNDTSGNIGLLFPNPRLTDAIAQVEAGKTYWLPHKDGQRWYVLDDNPGTETIYFVASRNRNPKLEELSQHIADPFSPKGISGEKSASEKQGSRPGTEYATAQPVKPEAAEEIKDVLNLMGFAQHTVPKAVEKASYSSKEEMFKNLDSTIRVSGAQALFKIVFKHESN